MKQISKASASQCSFYLPLSSAGIDYRAENGTITFPVKSCRSCATLDLLDDDIFEELETFQFSLSSNDPTRVIINSSTAEVHITDASDGKRNFSNSKALFQYSNGLYF